MEIRKRTALLLARVVEKTERAFAWTVYMNPTTSLVNKRDAVKNKKQQATDKRKEKQVGIYKAADKRRQDSGLREKEAAKRRRKKEAAINKGHGQRGNSYITNYNVKCFNFPLHCCGLHGGV